MNRLTRLAAIAAVAITISACSEQQSSTETPLPVALTEESVGHYCNMTILEHTGPKAQIHLIGNPHPIWFSQVRDGIAFLRSPEENYETVAVYVNDMGKAKDWDFPENDTWIDASEAWFVPETTPLVEQLNAFRQRKSHFALVVDEYGSLMGLVTLEDIIEEIVGDITDEHDVEVKGLRPQPDGSFNVDGTLAVRDLNRALDWDLPEEEAITIAGLVIHEAQTIPEVGQTFSFYGFKFQVLRRHRNQITALKIIPPRKSQAAE